MLKTQLLEESDRHQNVPKRMSLKSPKKYLVLKPAFLQVAL